MICYSRKKKFVMKLLSTRFHAFMTFISIMCIKCVPAPNIIVHHLIQFSLLLLVPVVHSLNFFQHFFLLKGGKLDESQGNSMIRFAQLSSELSRRVNGIILQERHACLLCLRLLQSFKSLKWIVNKHLFTLRLTFKDFKFVTFWQD